MDTNTNYTGLIDRSVLLTELRQYDNVNDKIHRLVASGELIRIRRGKYVTKTAMESGRLSKYQVANALYSPSYVSFFSALEYHGMIPERVDMVESATILRSKRYKTPIGNFSFKKMKTATFSYGVSHHNMGDVGYLMANPTKALIDVLWTEDISGIYGTKGLYHYLIDNLRIDEEWLTALDIDLLKHCAENGTRARILNLLINLISKAK